MSKELPSKVERLKVREEFIKRWSLKKVKKLTLEEYADNSKNDAFWYWIDFKTKLFISTGRTLPYAHGIYQYKKIPGKKPFYGKDNKYVWLKKYGLTADEAFKNIKSKIIKIIEYSLQNDKNAIEEIDFSPAVKWKIAILYNPEKYVTIVQRKALIEAAKQKGLENAAKKTIVELQDFLVTKRPKNLDYIDYSDEIWYNTIGKNIEKVNENNDVNYWIFQANPKKYDIVSALKDNNLKTWSVSQHKKEIKKGDKIILWVVGDNPGCYALCTVTSDVLFGEEDEIEMKYYTELSKNEPHDGVKINIDYNLAERPILYNEIREYKDLKELKTGLQGTNFRATKEQYDKILEIIMKNNKQYWLYAPGENAQYWDEFYENNNLGLGWDKMGDLNKYKSEQELKTALDKNQYSIVPIFKIMDDFKNNMKIGDIVIVKKGRKKILGWGIVNSNYYYDKNRETFQKCREVDWKQQGEWKTDVNLPIKTLTNITEQSYLNDILELLNINNTKIELIDTPPPFARNTILYGPPGTGKTYSTFDRAVEIVAKSKYEGNDHDDNVEVFRKYLNKSIFFITFHQNYGYEEFVGGLRPVEQEENLKFKWLPGVFITACAAAFKNEMSEENVNDEDIEYFLQECEQNPEKILENYERNHNVVLIIDEINRANISRVFGELITLIEQDKRIGGNHGMILTLPNGKKFGVPSNLYILGTMNTADKSIAHLDAALRRRFRFEPLYPNVELIDDSKKKEFLKKLNENIYKEKKSADLLIGHSYFMNGDKLIEIVERNIIPLLMEYFSNDFEKVQKLLNDSGVKFKYNEETYTWDIE